MIEQIGQHEKESEDAQYLCVFFFFLVGVCAILKIELRKRTPLALSKSIPEYDLCNVREDASVHTETPTNVLNGLFDFVVFVVILISFEIDVIQRFSGG